MKLKNLVIENFRSYYGENSIEFGENLTLILGGNGDGKTTLFDAMEWLFFTPSMKTEDTDTMHRAIQAVDNKYISKKKLSELNPSDYGQVRVCMTYENMNIVKVVEKSFRFNKEEDGKISTSSYSFSILVENGIERLCVTGEHAVDMFDSDFTPAIRKYCMFKGEESLDIFNKPSTTRFLIETFSQLRDFDHFIDFMEEAKKKSERATEIAFKADKKNSNDASRLRSLITNEEQQIGTIEKELNQKEGEVINLQSLLDRLEESRETSELLVNTNKRIQSLEDDRQNAANQIKDIYNFRLLDEMWILMGFEPIAEDYRVLVASLEKKRRELQSTYDQEIGAKKTMAHIQQELNDGHIPLAINIPDENTMREMLDEEFCKVCGRPAKKGSQEYNYMQKRLENFLASLKKDDMEYEPLFVHDYIKELYDYYGSLHRQMGFIKRLNEFIDKAISNNIKNRQKVNQISENIAKEEERKQKILAQSDGLTEDQLISAFRSVHETWNSRLNAERRATILKQELEKHEKILKGYREDYAKISQDSQAAMYYRSSQALRLIYEAFKEAKEKNKRDFYNQLQVAANEYLEQLNTGDFRGRALIEEGAKNTSRIILIDMDGSRIYNPNTSLETSMYMALLFAIAKLASEKKENSYPLIFDAPTSSFEEAKEKDFFEVIANIDRQTVIVTKSFIKDNKEGTTALDMNRLAGINAVKYYLKLKEPFDERDLSTIQTTINYIG